ncbi:hypothetical protein [Dielma fastidiosa]|uniref:hypothetical protein n=1 Tax=Dielma fastidiosa TaxID=1034346 RepID=UPI003561B9BB
MFIKDNIKFNIFFYMLIFLGWAFISDGELPSFAAYFFHPVIFVTILINSLWILANVMYDKHDN